MNTTIPYETIKDSALYAPPNRESSWYIHYELPFFKAETDIKLTRPYSFFIKDSLRSQLKLIMKTIEKDCAEDFIPGGGIHYNVFCNQKSIISMTILHKDFSGRSYPLHFFNYSINNENLNILTEDSYDMKMINENSILHFLSIVNGDIEKTIMDALIKNDYDDFGRDMVQLDKEYIKEKLLQKKYILHNLPKSVIIVDHIDYKEDGILFCEIAVPSFLEDRYLSGTMSLFYTFKQLKPFLSEDFKSLINLT